MDGIREMINGTAIYYEENGDPDAGQTIVLLHGFLSSSFSFRMLVPFLAQDFHIISVDLPPFGNSGKAKTFQYSYQNIASTVLQLLEKLGIDRFSVAGHSMGGQIALNMMLQAPEKIYKGVLLCSSSYYARAKKRHIVASYLPFFPFFVKRYLAKTGVVGNLKSVIHDPGLINREMIQGYARQFEDPRIFSSLALLLRHREGDLPEEKLRMIQTPCLLLWGEYDKIVPLRIGKKLEKDLNHSKLIVLKETGHLLPEERPQEVYKEIKAFLHARQDS
ncbi:alpha/beta fold hydrolase [Siminovitchia sediminis]|uniref:Alpha/beta fold hydrolase n=1 Tax=Siminovitchia sediminis TaxID=1274353 RepID=A0ABW4KI47_9BACI